MHMQGLRSDILKVGVCLCECLRGGERQGRG